MIDSKLYKDGFDELHWEHKEKLDFLQRNLIRIEEIVDKYLSNIENDFPQLTDHSIKHSKKLWQYADIIVGNQKNYLTPVESFVLHSVFLIHDAGMCYSTLNNREEIENDSVYLDYIARHGNGIKFKEEALFFTVRARHGDYALRIAVDILKNGEFLIENENLREELGLFIGKIAKSHTENINYIDREFSVNYSIPSLPPNWRLDCQKLAFILRASDAAHMDNLRTPKSSKIIAEIKGISKHHWTFQKKIGFPSLFEDSLLEYSTNSPFKINEQKAWWYCYDAILVLDRELKAANEFFNSRGQLGFKAIGVKLFHDTLTLGRRYLRTEGWDALDTSIKVSNPIHIAAELGGKKLYGQISYAIRKLIQNSVDAIHLYRIQTSQVSSQIGEINISLTKEVDEYYLTISDNGIGMSENLITNELLDFGGSYWKSNRFNYEFEGLRSKGFDSIGKFGIGFFSIFMLGNVVQVTSWKYGESIDRIKTLDFYDGLFSSPIFRNSTKDEKDRVLTRGTSIKIKLEINPFEKDGLLTCNNFEESNLHNLVRHYAPFIDVKINVGELNGDIKTLEPSVAINYEVLNLIKHVCIPTKKKELDSLIGRYKNYQLPLHQIINKGNVIGRLALRYFSDDINSSAIAVVVSKGIRVASLEGLIGFLFIEDVVNIKRDNFSCNIAYEVLREWARKQIDYIESNELRPHYSFNYYALLIAFRFDDENTPICLTKNKGNYKLVSIREFEKFISNNDEIRLFKEGFVPSTRNDDIDGFVSMTIKMNFEKLVDESEKSKIVDINYRMQEILEKIWGNYKLTNIDFWTNTPTFIESPYTAVELYSRVT